MTMTPASYWCEPCQRELLATQVEEIRSGTGFMAICPTCRRPLRAATGDLAERPFAQVLAGAFLFVARPASLAWIAGMALVATFVTYVPFFGGILSAIVQISYLFGVLRASSAGEDDFVVAPDDITDTWSWLAPLMRYSITVAIAVLPALVAGFLTGNPVAVGVGVLVGAVYLPAGMIVAAHGSGCLGPINPVPAAQIVGRIPGPYAMTLGFLAIAAVLGYGLINTGAHVAAALKGVPVLPGVVQLVAGLIPAVVMARMLGLLVYEHGHRI